MTAGYKEVHGKIGVGGIISRILFWGWQALMLFWFLSYSVQVSPTLNSVSTQAERVGAGIGVTIAVGMIVFFWLAGSVIFGLFVLFTRVPKTLVPIDDEKS